MVLIKLSNSLADFTEIRELIALMGAWDAAEMRARGLPDEEVLRAYYSDTPDGLMAKFTTVGAGMLIAHLNGSPAGCVGFSRVNERSAELQKMFVRPQYRGEGIGGALMAGALTRMREANYTRAELETVSFMVDAINLYSAYGFKPCDWLREVPQSVREITVFMERDL